MYIFGAGGHGKVVLDILLSKKETVIGFIDDNPAKKGKEVNGYKVFGDFNFIAKKKGVLLALGIGDNQIRERIYTRALEAGIKIVEAIHDKAVVSEYAKIGEGVVIMPGAVVNSSARLEEGVVVNTGSTVDHDCLLKRFCHIWPGAHLAGTVTVGEFSYVGTGASVIPNLKIGRNTTVGAGAVVIKDIPDNVTVVGVPACIKKKE
ncbi:MAG: acetyltransferase [Candidatus Omnitrophica bacterium]|nr:acetyltransferase [Candidatus Omnitrophota bacterium]